MGEGLGIAVADKRGSEAFGVAYTGSAALGASWTG